MGAPLPNDRDEHDQRIAEATKRAVGWSVLRRLSNLAVAENERSERDAQLARRLGIAATIVVIALILLLAVWFRRSF